MNKRTIVLFLGIVSFTFGFSQQEVPFTLEDKERIIKIEEKLNSTNERIRSTNNRINSLEKQMNVKFEDQQRQIDDLKTMFTWGFSILITLMLFVLGYIIYDRRTAMYPIKENLRNQSIEVERIKAVLKEMGESDQKINEILKRAAIF